MNNIDKYSFSDFTLTEYKKLLVTAKKSWAFRTYDTFDKSEKFILWRHDVDLSMHAARNLAIIENSLGIASTYFVLPHSEFYNLFEKEITDLVKTIILLGHEVGLHFDTHYYGIKDEVHLEKYLLQEKRWMQEVFEKQIKVFSFHNTTDFTMNCKQWQYAGMINTYADYFQSEVIYNSDSHGIWRFKRLKELLEEPGTKPLQVLTHPEWWQAEIMSPKQRVLRCLNGRMEKHTSYYNNLLQTINQPNIDWE